MSLCVMHEFTLVATIAAGFGLALVFGFLAHRLGAPPLVGYLVAGIAIGPATPGFVADMELTAELAEIGVMLMMFGVGLHFSIRDLMAVQRIAIPGAIVQITTATALAAVTAQVWGWSLGASLVFGIALSVASTVVLLRALEARHALNTVNGRIAVGWLIVEDVFVVLVLVVLPAVAGLLGGSTPAAQGDESLGRTIGLTLTKVAAFIALMLIVGRRVLPRVLWLVASTGSRELFTLAVISAAVGVAYASSELFSVSFALGAFFAGMMLRESALSHRAAEESLPLRDAFSVLFFVSVGMLFDPAVVIGEPLKLLATVAIIMIGKTAAAVALVLALRYPLSTALTVGAGLAQVGEFSFILASLGGELGLLPREGRSLILAAALVSITLNPVMFAAIDPVVSWVRSSSVRARALERSPDPLAELPATVDVRRLTGHVLLVGYGRIGRRIADALAGQGIPFVLAEQRREAVEDLRARQIPAVSGDASEAEVLVQAHVARAGMLVIATSDTAQVRRMVEIARTLNPRIEIVIRVHSEEEKTLFEQERLGRAFMGEETLAVAMTEYILSHAGGPVAAGRHV
ncbi:MAG TPA: cation:proton antiporter [Gemmatimonadales bacterium]|nr:cation:proton antiporter [Gemmatimonadales bacterium]